MITTVKTNTSSWVRNSRPLLMVNSSRTNSEVTMILSTKMKETTKFKKILKWKQTQFIQTPRKRKRRKRKAPRLSKNPLINQFVIHWIILPTREKKKWNNYAELRSMALENNWWIVSWERYKDHILPLWGKEIWLKNQQLSIMMPRKKWNSFTTQYWTATMTIGPILTMNLKTDVFKK